MTQKKIAIIVPYYKAESKIEALVSRISQTFKNSVANWTLFFVDDRSPDSGWEKINEIAQTDNRVIGIRLSRNFGQHPAISAGLFEAGDGFDYYVVMDCDLQDRPEDILTLYNSIESSGSEIVIAKRLNHALGIKRFAGSYIFNKVLSWLSEAPITSEVGNFRIFSQKAYRAYCKYQEQMRFFPLLMHKVGFDVEYVDLQRDERSDDSSSYTFKKLAFMAFDAFIAYSEKPLRISALFGFIVFIGTIFVGLGYLLSAMIGNITVPGFATLILAVIGFGGIQVFLISFIGLYIGQVLRETKVRPIYIVDINTSKEKV